MKRLISLVFFLFLSISVNAQLPGAEVLDFCQTNSQCSGNAEYCAKAVGQCSDAISGSCTLKPELCTLEFAPVCGCDGATYSNACKAATAGVNVAFEGDCDTFNPPLPDAQPKQKNDNYLIAKARNSVKECIKSAKEPAWDIVSSVNVVSSCFAGGFITDVDFYKQLHCKVNDPFCPRAIRTHVATVQFGCDNEVISAQCLLNTCSDDTNCETGQWCRQTTTEGVSTCVDFSQEGERCEGFTLPSFQERCEPGLLCVHKELTFDAPGTCATCNYMGTPKFLGDTFIAADGCNSCTCLEGGQVSCTEMACAPE